MLQRVRLQRVISARNDKTLCINVAFCLRSSFRSIDETTSCIINRRRFPTITLALPRVRRQMIANPRGWDRTKVTATRRTSVERSLPPSPTDLFSIRDDIWTRSRVGLTGCRSAWARFYDDFVFLRDVCGS